MKKYVLIIITIAFISGVKAQSDVDFKSLNYTPNLLLQDAHEEVGVKKADISALPEKYTEEYRKKHNIPEDFPKYIDTGDRKHDMNLYHERKQEWIKNNPELYNRIKHISL